MKWLRDLFNAPPAPLDEIADIRPALGALVLRYLRQDPDRTTELSLTLRGGTINGSPVGDWRLTLRPLPAIADGSGEAGQTRSIAEGLDPKGDSAGRSDSEGIAQTPPEVPND